MAQIVKGYTFREGGIAHAKERVPSDPYAGKYAITGTGRRVRIIKIIRDRDYAFPRLRVQDGLGAITLSLSEVTIVD